MMDQSLPSGAPAARPPAAGHADQEMLSRLQQGRITFAATIWALKGECPCQACQLLRRAVEGLLGDVYKEIEGDGVNPNPAP